MIHSADPLLDLEMRFAKLERFAMQTAQKLMELTVVVASSLPTQKENTNGTEDEGGGETPPADMSVPPRSTLS